MIKRKNLVKVNDNAMSPILNVGDEVIFKTIEFKKIKVNDIVYFKRGDKFEVMRAIYRKSNYLIVQADAKTNAYMKIFKSNIIGLIFARKIAGATIPIETIYYIQSGIYLKEINTITRTLTKNMVDFAILKGLPLHLYYEKKIPKRIYADCDLLIAKKNFEIVAMIFHKFGYKKEIPLNISGKTFQDRPEISFSKHINGFLVVFDVHREAVFLMTNVGQTERLYSQDLLMKLTNKMLNEKRSIIVQGTRYPVLEKNNLAVYLLLHLFNHNFKGAYRYEFILTLFRYSLDCEKIVNTLKDYRLDAFAYPSLYILEKYFRSTRAMEIMRRMKIKKSKLKYIKKILEKIELFKEDELGVGRHFFLLFNLSHQNFWEKILVFMDVNFIKSILAVMHKKSRELLTI